MPNSVKNKLEKLHEYVYLIKFVLQMIIGLVVLGLLIAYALIGYELLSIHQTTSSILAKSLQTVSFGLGISAGIEMAYMLFTPGPDEAVEPVILSLSAATLYCLSVIDFKNTESFYAYAVLIGTFVISIGILFVIKERFISKGKPKSIWKYM